MYAEGVEGIVVHFSARLRLVAAKKQITPEARPITSAPIGPAVPAAGDRHRPATTPDAMPRALGLPW